MIEIKKHINENEFFVHIQFAEHAVKLITVVFHSMLSILRQIYFIGTEISRGGK